MYSSDFIAENFKAKINTSVYRFKTLISSWFSFCKNCHRVWNY